MGRIVGTVAMTAAMVVIGQGLFLDYTIVAILKRAALAYIAAFAVTSLLVMVFRHGIQDEWIRKETERRIVELKKKKEQRLADEEKRLAQQLARKAPGGAPDPKPGQQNNAEKVRAGV